MVEVVNAYEFTLIFSYLSKTESSLKVILDKANKAFNECVKAKVDEHNSYNGILTKVANKYKSDAEDIIDDIRYDSKVFTTNISICSKNKEKNEFLQYKQKLYASIITYQKLKKEFEKFDKKINDAINTDKSSDDGDARKYSAYLKISIKNTVFIKMISYIIDQLNKIEGWDTED